MPKVLVILICTKGLNTNLKLYIMEMEIKISKLGTNSVLGVFAKQYIHSMSGYMAFHEFMRMYRGCTVTAMFTPSGQDMLDNEVMKSNKDFCNEHGLIFKIVE